MKTVPDFERFTPPVLTEAALRRELERRAERRRTVLIAVAGALIQAVFILFGLLCRAEAPALALASVIFAAVSTAGSGVIAIVYTQKGGADNGPVD